jgi:hypothetical protein
MNNIDNAFVRGFLKKQADAGIQKEAFLPLLLSLGLNIGGGILGQQAAKRITPSVSSWAAKTLAGRLSGRALTPAAAQRLGAGATPKVLSQAQPAAGAMSRGYDKTLNWLKKRNNASMVTDNVGFMAGSTLAPMAGEMVFGKPEQA